MQLGKELATGFVQDEAQTTDAGAGLPPDEAAMETAEGTPIPEPEPATAG